MRYAAIWVLSGGLLMLSCKDPAPDVGVGTEHDTHTGGADSETGFNGGDAGDSRCVSAFDRFQGALFGQVDQGFTVRIFDDMGTVEGGVLSASPLAFHEEADRIGDCRLLTYEGASCDESCAFDGRQCFNGRCVDDYPIYVEAGVLTVQDSTGFMRDLSPTDIDSYFYQVAELKRPGTEWVSAEITVDGQAVVLKTCVPEPLNPDPPLDDVAAAWRQGEDLVLRWDNVEPNARIYLHITTGIGSHGGISPVEIECEGPDRGGLTIPAAFLTALNCEPLCWSCGECGYHYLTRYHTDEETVAGKVVRLNNVHKSLLMLRPDGR